jgi:hypothetical protein
MSFAGRLARGLLQGASGYFGDLAERQEYDRRSAILQQRDEALELLRQSGRRAELDELQAAEASPKGPPAAGRRPGEISADGRSFWDGRWVAITPATWGRQQRLERHGQ